MLLDACLAQNGVCLKQHLLARGLY